MHGDIEGGGGIAEKDLKLPDHSDGHHDHVMPQPAKKDIKSKTRSRIFALKKKKLIVCGCMRFESTLLVNRWERRRKRVNRVKDGYGKERQEEE